MESREKYAAEAKKRGYKGEQRRAYINWKLAHERAVTAKVAPNRKKAAPVKRSTRQPAPALPEYQAESRAWPWR